ncbi:MAG: hypothetical protein GXP62_16610, partial [Oligoflexia bacterium]|nr:hypothetical protein [Oligoflexia bacterium]
MPVSHEQRQRQQQAEDLQAQQEAKDKEALQQLEEGQEISQEQAGQLQPQIGNAALAALLAHAASASASASASAGITAAEEDVGEELVEVQDEEEVFAEELNASVYGGGGGGAGVPGGPADPWDMGKLFGGDDDGTPAGGGPRGGRVRPSPIRPGTLPIDEDLDDEDDVEAVPDEHIEAVMASLPAVPRRRTTSLWGDAIHCAVEDALGETGAIARLSLSPEDLVRRGGPGSPVGRPLAIGRFLAAQASAPLARCLGRALAGGSATMLVAATGAAGATARLATLAVCAQVAESGGTDGQATVDRAAATDRAVALALTLDAWPRTILAARKLARRHRLHAPEIAERALGRSLAPGGVVGGELPAEALGSRALASLIPQSRPVDVPDLQAPPLDPVASDEETATVDALLAEFTGGRDPRAPPS